VGFRSGGLKGNKNAKRKCDAIQKHFSLRLVNSTAGNAPTVLRMRDTRYVRRACPAGGRYRFPPGTILADNSREIAAARSSSAITTRYRCGTPQRTDKLSFFRHAKRQQQRGEPPHAASRRRLVEQIRGARERGGNRHRENTRKREREREGGGREGEKKRADAHTWCPWAPRVRNFSEAHRSWGARRNFLSQGHTMLSSPSYDSNRIWKRYFTTAREAK
jgi:hypothetical protein